MRLPVVFIRDNLSCGWQASTKKRLASKGVLGQYPELRATVYALHKGVRRNWRSRPEASIELRLIFELLAAKTRHDKARFDFRQCGHVHPKFFKLGDWKNIFLAVTPAPFDLLWSNVHWHFFREIPNPVAILSSDAGPASRMSSRVRANEARILSRSPI